MLSEGNTGNMENMVTRRILRAFTEMFTAYEQAGLKMSYELQRLGTAYVVGVKILNDDFIGSDDDRVDPTNRQPVTINGRPTGRYGQVHRQ